MIFLVVIFLFLSLFLFSYYFKPSHNSRRLVNSENLSEIVQKCILTDNEIEFFYRLQRALPSYYIFPQVSLGAILDATYETGRQSTRNSFAQKIADYVVCNSLMQVMAIIELDDKTHNVQKDVKRDSMLNSAGYRVIRFQSTQKPTELQIAAYFDVTNSSFLHSPSLPVSHNSSDSQTW